LLKKGRHIVPGGFRKALPADKVPRDRAEEITGYVSVWREWSSLNFSKKGYLKFKEVAAHSFSLFQFMPLNDDYHNYIQWLNCQFAQIEFKPTISLNDAP
jgi:hypothetical protein